MHATDNHVESTSGPARLKFTRQDFYRMSENGAIPDRNVELLEGEIFEMAPQKDAHALAVVFTDYALRRVFAEGFTIRVQLPFAISELSDPEPDLTVLAGLPRSHSGHPTSALLVAEVADTSLEYDRTIKAATYAKGGVADYWIVDLNHRCLHVHRQPIFDSVRSVHRYAEVIVLHPPSAVSPLAAPGAQILIKDLLP